MENTMHPFRDTTYFVTEEGKCFHKGKEIKGSNHYKGYTQICVYKNGKKLKTFYLHRMVAETLIPNPMNLPQINHIDGNKKNNHISNLEWVDQSKNIQHRLDILKVGMDDNHKSTKLPAKEVLILRWKKSIGYPMNYREIAKKWGIRVDYLRKIVSGKQRTRV